VLVDEFICTALGTYASANASTLDAAAEAASVMDGSIALKTVLSVLGELSA